MEKPVSHVADNCAKVRKSKVSGNWNGIDPNHTKRA
jgi:hypothetical protein